MMRWVSDPQPVSVDPTTYEELSRVWELRRQIRKQHAARLRNTTRLSESVERRLAVKAASVKAERPNPIALVADTPDVVAWLRSQMTAKPLPGDGDSKPSGKPGSKPPFRIAFMNAADREIAALAHWAVDVCGLTYSGRTWRVGNKVRGLASDVEDLWPVFSMAEELVDYLENGYPVSADFMDHPKYGMWQIRSQHFGAWPQLAAMFAEVPAAEDEQEGLF